MLFGIRSRPFVLLLATFLVLTTIAFSQATFEFEKQFMYSVQDSSGNSIVDLGVWLITESGNVFVMLPFSVILLIIRRTRRIKSVIPILLVRRMISKITLNGNMTKILPDSVISQTVRSVKGFPEAFCTDCMNCFSDSNVT